MKPRHTVALSLALSLATLPQLALAQTKAPPANAAQRANQTANQTARPATGVVQIGRGPARPATPVKAQAPQRRRGSRIGGFFRRIGGGLRSAGNRIKNAVQRRSPKAAQQNRQRPAPNRR